jgi:hypothetical protein
MAPRSALKEKIGAQEELVEHGLSRHGMIGVEAEDVWSNWIMRGL